MEESITLLTKIKQTFDCEGQDVRAYSPLTLAYIGDGIYELVIRSIVVCLLYTSLTFYALCRTPGVVHHAHNGCLPDPDTDYC